jgi:hypothetical protein
VVSGVACGGDDEDKGNESTGGSGSGSTTDVQPNDSSLDGSDSGNFKGGKRELTDDPKT